MVSKIESRGEAASAGGPGRVLAQSTQLSGALGLKAVRNAWSEKDVGQERNLIQNTGNPTTTTTALVSYGICSPQPALSKLEAVKLQLFIDLSFFIYRVDLVLCRSKNKE